MDKDASQDQRNHARNSIEAQEIPLSTESNYTTQAKRKTTKTIADRRKEEPTQDAERKEMITQDLQNPQGQHQNIHMQNDKTPRMDYLQVPRKSNRKGGKKTTEWKCQHRTPKIRN